MLFLYHTYRQKELLSRIGFSEFFILFCRNGSGKVEITFEGEKLRLEIKFLRVCGFLKMTGPSRLPVEA